MAFELIEKTMGTPTRIKDNQLSVCKTGINFGSLSMLCLNKGYVKVYLDRENKRVGFEPTEDNIKGFKLDRRDTPRIGCVNITKIIPLGRYEVEVDEGMVIIFITGGIK